MGDDVSASLTLDTSQFDRLVANISNPVIREEIMRIPQKKAIAALVAQAIADNFNQEGPGWAPLKPETIRNSVSKKLKEKLKGMSDQQLLQFEKKARKSGGTPHRRILRKSGLLFKSATTVGAPGNIYKTEGTNLIFGTNLVYAAVHNYGEKSKHIPKREFMDVKKHWLDQIHDYMMDQIMIIVKSHLEAT